MQRLPSRDTQPALPASANIPPVQLSEDLFRQEFQHSLSVFIRKGFAVERCFGFVWEKTLEAVPIPDTAKAKLYSELIAWAKKWVAQS